MTDLEKRLNTLGVKFSDYPIDHIGYRVETDDRYRELHEVFRRESVLYTEKLFHGRNFSLFVLRRPFVFREIEIPYLELPQPGGSDSYREGFQHIEFHTNVRIEEIAKSHNQITRRLFKSKHGDEVYLKWSDKIAVKVTTTPIITKSLLDGDSEVYIKPSRVRPLKAPNPYNLYGVMAPNKKPLRSY